ncbi:calcium-binding protein [Novosphingobium sp.]|uniref:calcium-binding protein n=1 Tax=Novosphingobium sp. TaxID=1874826 RepID=UPI00333FA8C3
MAKTVRYGSLDALLGVTFAANSLVNISASAVNGSITNSTTSPNQILNYQGLLGTVGRSFIAMSTVSYKVVAVSNADDMVTIDAFVGQTLVGELNFTVCGFSPVGIALAAMPLDSLVTQSANLPGLNGSLFVLGVGAVGARSYGFNFGIGGSYTFVAGAKVLYATTASPVITGGYGPHLLVGLSGNDRITAGPGKTVIQAGPGNDVIYAGSGENTIYAGDGTDVIYGGTGGAAVFGGAGHAEVHPGTGKMIMVAGSGQDTFVFAPGKTGGLTTTTCDVIQKFHANPGNVIDLSAFDSLLPAGGPTHLSFLGTAAFDMHAGQLRYEAAGTGLMVFGDINGDGKADFALNLTKLTSLSAGDFIL